MKLAPETPAISGSASRMISMTCRSEMSNCWSQISSVICAISRGTAIPTMSTTPVSVPNRSLACSTSRLTAAAWVMSPVQAVAAGPSSATTASTRAWSRSTQMTCAPLATRA